MVLLCQAQRESYFLDAHGNFQVKGQYFSKSFAKEKKNTKHYASEINGKLYNVFKQYICH